ncbi:MAG: hypothetical protein JWM57_2365 [Phycisphaerales bacterium]|nr:hypothetical protein [Phycisphaerales bacterium]
MGEANSMLPHSTQPPFATVQGRYAVASLTVSSLSVLWMIAAITFLDLPFDGMKHHRIGSIAAVLSLILAWGASRAEGPRRRLVRTAWAAAVFALLVYVVLQPL